MTTIGVPLCIVLVVSFVRIFFAISMLVWQLTNFTQRINDFLSDILNRKQKKRSKERKEQKIPTTKSLQIRQILVNKGIFVTFFIVFIEGVCFVNIFFLFHSYTSLEFITVLTHISLFLSL